MFQILIIVIIFNISIATLDCTAIKIEECELNEECQILNSNCINRWKNCYQIKQPSAERCKKLNCEYDQDLNFCTEQLQKSLLEPKIQEALNKNSSNLKNSHKYQKQQKHHNKKYQDHASEKQIYSDEELEIIKQKISEINKTQFQQLNYYIISFATALSFSCIMMNLLLY